MTGCLLLFTKSTDLEMWEAGFPQPKFLQDFATLPKSLWPSESLLGCQWISWKYLYKARQMGISYCPLPRNCISCPEFAPSIPWWRVQGQPGVLSPCQRPIWFDPLRPLAFVAIGFCICSKANKFLALKFRAFHAGPGSPSQQAKPSPEDYAAESSTVCTDEALITFRYFLKPHWSDFRYMLCQDLRPVFKSTWLP